MDGSFALQAVWVAIHLVGLSAAWAARREAFGPWQRIAQQSFFLCVPLIAVLTIIGQLMCLTTWPLSAATLGAMIVMAVVDFEVEGKPQAARER